MLKVIIEEFESLILLRRTNGWEGFSNSPMTQANVDEALLRLLKEAKDHLPDVKTANACRQVLFTGMLNDILHNENISMAIYRLGCSSELLLTAIDNVELRLERKRLET